MPQVEALLPTPHGRLEVGIVHHDGNMIVDIENQRGLLIPAQSKMPKWDKISKIIKTDDVRELRVQLENESLEMVVCPQDSLHYETALHVAVKSSATECLKTLLETLESLEDRARQDILNSPDSDGNTPLHVAVKSLNSNAVTALLKAEANPNLRDDKGHSPLHLLAYAAKVKEEQRGAAKVKEEQREAGKVKEEQREANKVSTQHMKIRYCSFS
ncbi:Ankyrin repeat-containing domain [Trinorchestia longiramus]|nr:Ankyrin repeat-containing domain [Trinorchestia longiramus]